MKKYNWILISVIFILFSSCSEMRFGHLAKVKNTSKKIEEIKNIKKVSVAKIDNNYKSLDSIFLANNQKEILTYESKNSQIHPKINKFSSKDFGLKNIITQNIPKKIDTKFEVFQEEIEPSFENTKKENPNATAGFILAVLALLLLIPIFTIHFTFDTYFILIVLVLAQFLFSLLAIVFGSIALAQISGNMEYNNSKILAEVAIIIGIMILAVIFIFQ